MYNKFYNWLGKRIILHGRKDCMEENIFVPKDGKKETGGDAFSNLMTGFQVVLHLLQLVALYAGLLF